MGMTEQPGDSQEFNKPIDAETSKPVDDSQTNRIAGVWNNTTERLIQFLPLDQISQRVVWRQFEQNCQLLKPF
jgi:hypothetical protein